MLFRIYGTRLEMYQFNGMRIMTTSATILKASKLIDQKVQERKAKLMNFWTKSMIQIIGALNFLHAYICFGFRRKVFDQQTGGEIELTDEQIEKLNNMATNRYSDPTYNPYEPFYDIFSHKKEIHPISNRPEDKRSFIPSASERKIVGRLLNAMKMGWLKPKQKKKPEEVGKLCRLNLN